MIPIAAFRPHIYVPSWDCDFVEGAMNSIIATGNIPPRHDKKYFCLFYALKFAFISRNACGKHTVESLAKLSKKDALDLVENGFKHEIFGEIAPTRLQLEDWWEFWGLDKGGLYPAVLMHLFIGVGTKETFLPTNEPYPGQVWSLLNKKAKQGTSMEKALLAKARELTFLSDMQMIKRSFALAFGDLEQDKLWRYNVSLSKGMQFLNGEGVIITRRINFNVFACPSSHCPDQRIELIGLAISGKEACFAVRSKYDELDSYKEVEGEEWHHSIEGLNRFLEKHPSRDVIPIQKRLVTKNPLFPLGRDKGFIGDLGSDNLRKTTEHRNRSAVTVTEEQKIILNNLKDRAYESDVPLVTSKNLSREAEGETKANIMEPRKRQSGNLGREASNDAMREYFKTFTSPVSQSEQFLLCIPRSQQNDEQFKPFKDRITGKIMDYPTKIKIGTQEETFDYYTLVQARDGFIEHDLPPFQLKDLKPDYKMVADFRRVMAEAKKEQFAAREKLKSHQIARLNKSKFVAKCTAFTQGYLNELFRANVTRKEMCEQLNLTADELETVKQACGGNIFNEPLMYRGVVYELTDLMESKAEIVIEEIVPPYPPHPFQETIEFILDQRECSRYSEPKSENKSELTEGAGTSSKILETKDSMNSTFPKPSTQASQSIFFRGATKAESSLKHDETTLSEFTQAYLKKTNHMQQVKELKLTAEEMEEVKEMCGGCIKARPVILHGVEVDFDLLVCNKKGYFDMSNLPYSPLEIIPVPPEADPFIQAIDLIKGQREKLATSPQKRF